MQKDFITATPDSGGSGTTTVTAAASANQSESARSTTLSVGGGGMTRSVSVNQSAGAVSWVYTLTVSPTSLSFAGGGEAKGFTITSTKQKQINGVNSGSPVAVGTTNSITGTGFTISGNTVTAARNQTESSRSGSVTVTQAESGKTATVSLSQAAGVVTWNYYFTVSPTTLSFVAAGEAKTVTVSSYRKKAINGTETSTQENVAWTARANGPGFTINTNGTSVTASANSGTSGRGGSVSYTQTGSNKTAGVSLSQAASVAYTLTISGLTSGQTYYMFYRTITPVSPPQNYTGYANNQIGGNWITTWNPANPIRINDPSATSGGTMTATNGTQILIRRYSNGWITVANFTLQAQNQNIPVSG